MRAIITALFVCFNLLACDTNNSAKLNGTDSNSNDGLVFDDQFAGIQASDTLLRVNSSISSTSPDGTVADLLLTYTLDPYIRSALKANSYVQFEYVAPDQPGQVVARSVITDELGGTVEASIPTTDDAAKLVATVGGLQPGVIENEGVLVAQLPAIIKRETTDLLRVRDIRAELVDGSYESEIIDGRRLHRFAVKVIDPTAGPIDDLLSDDDDPAAQNYTISGLEKNASAHFVARENEIEDIESPVTVSFTDHPLAVYLVMDTSKSVVESRQVHNLSNAVSNSVIALAQNAVFDYRTFNGQVTRVNGLREMDFDSGDTSATALYYAIDTVLSDIENFGSIGQDKIVMVFTDGIDLASRNHYNGDLIDHDQVHEYIIQRVKQVRDAQQDSLGRQLDVYTIGFYDQDTGIDVPEEIRKLDAISKAGGTTKSFNNLNASDIEGAFAAVVRNVQGVYYLQYSSQQTPADNKLELLINVNGHEDSILLPTEYNTSDTTSALVP